MPQDANGNPVGIRAVLDPNVIVSGLISSNGPPGRILAAWEEQRAFDLVVSRHLLSELEDVLSREKFRPYFTIEEVRRRIGGLRRRTTVFREENLRPLSLDPEDDYLIALAKTSLADYLVSGDKPHLLALELRDYPPVISPRDFLMILEEYRSNRS